MEQIYESMGSPEAILDLMDSLQLTEAIAVKHNLSPVALGAVMRRYASPVMLEQLLFETIDMAGLRQAEKKY